MPTGQKTIVWTAENDERLLLSILAVHNVKIDATKVAEVFGNNILPSVVQTRMTKLKAKARALNPDITPTNANESAPATKRARGGKNGKATTGRKKRVKKEADADATEHGHATPPATPSRKSLAAAAGTTGEDMDDADECEESCKAEEVSEEE